MDEQLPEQVVVTSLTFHTDKGETYGPYGEETGTPFSIPAANGCIVGFWGRSGWLLDAIGVYITPCKAHNIPSPRQNIVLRDNFNFTQENSRNA
jgi:hypothetical protein